MNKILSIYYFLFFALIGNYVIFLPKYLINFFTPTEIGIIFSAMPIARFITPFMFLNKPITKKIFLNAIIISIIVSFFILTNNLYLIIISFFIIGWAFAIIFPFIETIAIEKLKEEYGKTRLFGSIGFMLFGIIFSYINFDFIYLFIINLIFTNLVALYFLEDKSIKKSHKSINLLKEWKFWIALILLQISFGGFYNFFTIYLIENGLDKKYIGWIWSIGVIAEIIIFLSQHKFLKKFSPIKWIKISIFLTSIRWILLYFFANNLIIISLSQLIHAFSFAIFHTAALLYISEKYENKTLAQQFYAGISYGFAAFLGSIISGILYSDKLFLYESIIALTGFLILI